MQLPDPTTNKMCHTRQILDRVGDKWSIAVIYSLHTEVKRFTELKHDIDGISQRMLTATVRTLERDGLVSRTVHPVVPPRVDYRLTDLGLTLLGTVCQLMGWAVGHADDIEAARAAYDERTAVRAASEAAQRSTSPAMNFSTAS